MMKNQNNLETLLRAMLGARNRSCTQPNPVPFAGRIVRPEGKNTNAKCWTRRQKQWLLVNIGQFSQFMFAYFCNVFISDFYSIHGLDGDHNENLFIFQHVTYSTFIIIYSSICGMDSSTTTRWTCKLAGELQRKKWYNSLARHAYWYLKLTCFWFQDRLVWQCFVFFDALFLFVFWKNAIPAELYNQYDLVIKQ